ncbi:hypothetical protein ONS95_004629 [Cadophora gregata]|uniref:uncharacterized protein n=1 Tax=Cadophora gregata TaxID=51156 RepID=UPI0026DC4334|nr:uncharacterized protein ONS95_004629 [Cadophora gregata]KAK0105001.1 hypothetical protein ONS96_004409 [Cadophora gregata f. sp. sojae]KAK0106127.1 hypothetical protein ONS95_004629 [Cadophora gregata]
MTSSSLTVYDPLLVAAEADNEIILQAIDSKTFPPHANLQTCEPERSTITEHLKYLTENFWYDSYRARTWGYTIVRTAYRPGDDEKFKLGIEVIHKFLRLWSDQELRYATEQIYGRGDRLGLRGDYEIKYYHWPEGMPETASSAPNECFLGRFVNDIVEDEENLSGASVPQVTEAFKQWCLAHWDGNPLHLSAASPRFQSCILMDAETLDELQTAHKVVSKLPSTNSRDLGFKIGGQFWIKMVERSPQPRYPSGTTDCYRLLLGDVADFWFRREWSDPETTTDPMVGQPEDVFWYISGCYGKSVYDTMVCTYPDLPT